MPRRLLREPHVLAHELRTPLSILAGWYSLVRDGDVSPTGTPAQWALAMTACQQAVDRLNFIISQACDEAMTLEAVADSPSQGRMQQLIEETRAAIDHSQAILGGVKARRA